MHVLTRARQLLASIPRRAPAARPRTRLNVEELGTRVLPAVGGVLVPGPATLPGLTATIPLDPCLSSAVPTQADNYEDAILLSRAVMAKHPDWPSAIGPVSVAQWALESGYGQHTPGGYNYFGVKALPGQPAVTAWTTEKVKGKIVAVQDDFRVYDSALAAFEDHARLLAEGAAYGKARKYPNNPLKFASGLTRYSTLGKAYVRRLQRFLRNQVLSRYAACVGEQPAPTPLPTPPVVVPPPVPAPTPTPPPQCETDGDEVFAGGYDTDGDSDCS